MAFFLEHWTELLPGAVTTAAVAAAVVPLFLPVALVTALARIHGPAPVRWLIIALVDIIRGTPQLVQLFWVFYALPFFGITLAPLEAGVMTLVIHFGAYGSEALRSGIEAVPRGQLEAARVLGLPRSTVLFRIVIPQALVIAYPVLSNQVVEIIKSTSLFSLVAVAELVTYGNRLRLQTFNATGSWIMVACFFFVLSYATAWGLARLEQKLPMSAALKGSLHRV